MHTFAPLKPKSDSANSVVTTRKAEHRSTLKGPKSERWVRYSWPDAVERHWIVKPPLQAKLEISEPGDALEQEADHVADQVMRMPETKANPARADQPRLTPSASLVPTLLASSSVHSVPRAAISPQPAPCQDERVQREAEAEDDEQAETVQRACQGCTSTSDDENRVLRSAGTARGGRSAVIHPFWSRQLRAAQAAGGEPLSAGLRALMEPRLDADFGSVRVYRDSQASALAESVHARAFTVGRDLFFKRGEFEPQSARGQRLIAHELTHVLQQSMCGRLIQRAPERTAKTGAGEGRSNLLARPQDERVVQGLYVARLAVEGIDMRLAVGTDESNAVLGKLGAMAAAINQTNALILDPQARVNLCVVASNATTRFATYQNRPVVVVAPENANAETVRHETGHALFEYLRSVSSAPGQPMQAAAGFATEIFARLSRTKPVTLTVPDVMGKKVPETHPAGLWMLDPTQWHGEATTEHPWQNPDEMLASAVEAFLTSPRGLDKSIAKFSRMDPAVGESASELRAFLRSIAQGHPPKGPTPSSESSRREPAASKRPVALEETLDAKVAGVYVNRSIRFALGVDDASR